MDLASWFMIIVTVLVLIFDLWLYLNNRKTISQIMIKWSEVFIIIPFAWGMLMGHWFL